MHLLKIEKLKNNPIVKAIFIMILFAFIWTFSDQSYLGNKNVIGAVDGKQITAKEFSTAYENSMRSLPPEMQKLASDENFTKYIKNSVLNQLVRQKWQDVFVEKLQISMPTKRIIEEIKKDPSFQKNGAFDQQIFMQILARLNIREKELIANMQAESSRNLLFTFINNNIDIKNTLFAKTLYPYYYQDINFDLVKVSVSGDNTPASEEEITSFYQKNKDHYQTMAERIVKLIDFSQIQSEGTFSEKVENIREEVYGGDDIEKIAKNNNLKIITKILREGNSLDLTGGSHAYPIEVMSEITAQILKADKNYGDVFSYEYKDNSGAVKYGAFIFEVTDIKDPRILALAEVRGMLLQDLAKEKQEKTLSDLAYMLYSAMSDKRQYPNMKGVVIEVERNQSLSLNDDLKTNSKLPVEIKDKMVNTADNKIITKVGNVFYLANIYSRMMPKQVDKDRLKYLELVTTGELREDLIEEIFVNSKAEIKIEE